MNLKKGNSSAQSREPYDITPCPWNMSEQELIDEVIQLRAISNEMLAHINHTLIRGRFRERLASARTVRRD